MKKKQLIDHSSSSKSCTPNRDFIRLIRSADDITMDVIVLASICLFIHLVSISLFHMSKTSQSGLSYFTSETSMSETEQKQTHMKHRHVNPSRWILHSFSFVVLLSFMWEERWVTCLAQTTVGTAWNWIENLLMNALTKERPRWGPRCLYLSDLIWMIEFVNE